MGGESLTPGGAQSSGWGQAEVSQFSFPQASLLGPPTMSFLSSGKPPEMPTGTGPFSKGSTGPVV